MKLFVCGFGHPARILLPVLVDKYGPENVYLFTHENKDRFGTHVLNLAPVLRIKHTVESVNDIDIWPFQPDMIISLYYRTIIKQPVIDAVNGKVFNAHTSLLPKHRGRSSIPWAIIDGDTHTGVTFHYINNEQIDAGPVILQAAVQITQCETQASLFDKVNRAVVQYFPAAFHLVKSGFPGVPMQGDGEYHHAGPPYGGEINPEWPFGKILRFIRAMTYPPLPYAKFDGKEIKSEGDYRQALADQWRRQENEKRRNHVAF